LHEMFSTPVFIRFHKKMGTLKNSTDSQRQN
jgi:hypothetical protein